MAGGIGMGVGWIGMLSGVAAIGFILYLAWRWVRAYERSHLK